MLKGVKYGDCDNLLYFLTLNENCTYEMVKLLMTKIEYEKNVSYSIINILSKKYEDDDNCKYKNQLIELIFLNLKYENLISLNTNGLTQLEILCKNENIPYEIIELFIFYLNELTKTNT